MKIKTDSFRGSDKTKKIEITDYLPDGIVTKGQKVFITIKRLTIEERDRTMARMATHQEYDPRVRKSKWTDDEWFHERRVRVLMAGVVQDDDFPFEAWDHKFISLIGAEAPELFEFLYGEIEDYNSPLASKKNSRSPSS